MEIYLNIVLDAEFPADLMEAFQNGAQEPIQRWAIKQMNDLLDGECETEFGAELLGVQVKTRHDR
jgi:hypothetical protein